MDNTEKVIISKTNEKYILLIIISLVYNLSFGFVYIIPDSEFLLHYFHSQIFPLVMLFSSASYSKTPVLLFRNASFPVDIVLKKY